MRLEVLLTWSGTDCGPEHCSALCSVASGISGTWVEVTPPQKSSKIIKRIYKQPWPVCRPGAWLAAEPGQAISCVQSCLTPPRRAKEPPTISEGPGKVLGSPQNLDSESGVQRTHLGSLEEQVAFLLCLLAHITSCTQLASHAPCVGLRKTEAQSFLDGL